MASKGLEEISIKFSISFLRISGYSITVSSKNFGISSSLESCSGCTISSFSVFIRSIFVRTKILGIRLVNSRVISLTYEIES